jgi:hypothetical protein
MSIVEQPAPFVPYQCTLGTVIGYEGSTYRIATADGRIIGISANGEPSEEAVETDIAEPPIPLATSAQIKAEASRRILILAPSWKQSNMIARTVELVRDYGTVVVGWPAEAQAENATYQGIWDQIKAIRAKSDALELDPPAASNLVAAFDL